MTKISDEDSYREAVNKLIDGIQELIDEFMEASVDRVNGGPCVDDSWLLLIGQQEFDDEMKPNNGAFTYLSKSGTPFWKLNGLCQTMLIGPGRD